MKDVSFYDPLTGEISAYQITASDPATVVVNTPEGYMPIVGHHDHRNKRVDIRTGEVIDWQPPAPSAEHEWLSDKKTWVPNATAQAREDARFTATVRISYLETHVYPRISRELQLSQGQDPDALKRLVALDNEISKLRKAL